MKKLWLNKRIRIVSIVSLILITCLCMAGLMLGNYDSQIVVHDLSTYPAEIETYSAQDGNVQLVMAAPSDDSHSINATVIPDKYIIEAVFEGEQRLTHVDDPEKVNEYTEMQSANIRVYDISAPRKPLREIDALSLLQENHPDYILIDGFISGVVRNDKYYVMLIVTKNYNGVPIMERPEDYNRYDVLIHAYSQEVEFFLIDVETGEDNGIYNHGKPIGNELHGWSIKMGRLAALNSKAYLEEKGLPVPWSNWMVRYEKQGILSIIINSLKDYEEWQKLDLPIFDLFPVLRGIEKISGMYQIVSIYFYNDYPEEEILRLFVPRGVDPEPAAGWDAFFAQEGIEPPQPQADSSVSSVAASLAYTH